MTDFVSNHPPVNRSTEYRKLPSVDALLSEPAIVALVDIFGKGSVLDCIRDLLAQARRDIADGEFAPEPDRWVGRIEAALQAVDASMLRPVINATGVIVHTNLGRAPLSVGARQAMTAVSQGYSNLEYDLQTGKRGSRHDLVRERLQRLTGAEDALIVNNNAAAVYLVLAALCTSPNHNNVVVSRGQLVEIGGGFRIPDVLRQSGATLVEVGTTNRTHLYDFEGALSEQTAAFMRIHSSNFRQMGFVTQPSLGDLVQLAQAHNRKNAHDPVLVIDNLGSGTLLDTTVYGLEEEPLVQDSIAQGADLVTFSGDKLLGGPQAGLIVGKKELIARLRRYPMARALRVDKLILAALDATLQSYQHQQATNAIPVWQMISASCNELRTRAEQWQQYLRYDDHSAHFASTVASQIPMQISIEMGESAVGGGSLPGETLPTYILAIAVAQPDAMAARLRALELPIICRIQQGKLLFDPRTVLPEQDQQFLLSLRNVLID